ncbi:hypothetical protein [Streptomyces albidoflavus]|uniref:hypothetical protein n=1 Tax=Streptomyces albidoflavus TaxID=1886 RepID=UPI003432194F
MTLLSENPLPAQRTASSRGQLDMRLDLRPDKHASARDVVRSQLDLWDVPERHRDTVLQVVTQLMDTAQSRAAATGVDRAPVNLLVQMGPGGLSIVVSDSLTVPPDQTSTGWRTALALACELHISPTETGFDVWAQVSFESEPEAGS